MRTGLIQLRRWQRDVAAGRAWKNENTHPVPLQFTLRHEVVVGDRDRDLILSLIIRARVHVMP